MSYQEKRSIVSVLSGGILLVVYVLNVLGRYRQGTLPGTDLKAWATTIMVFIGIAVVAFIIIQIVFHIMLSVSIAVTKAVKEGVTDNEELGKSIQANMIEDEMDKIISLKATRFSTAVYGFGFFVGLIAIVLNYSAVILLNSMFIAFCLGIVIEGIAQIFYYRRGIIHA